MAFRMGRIVGVRRSDIGLIKGLVPIAIAAGGAAAVSLLVRNALTGIKPLFSLVICAACYGLVYFLLILVMKIPLPDEREVVQRYLARLWRIDPKKGVSA